MIENYQLLRVCQWSVVESRTIVTNAYYLWKGSEMVNSMRSTYRLPRGKHKIVAMLLQKRPWRRKYYPSGRKLNKWVQAWAENLPGGMLVQIYQCRFLWVINDIRGCGQKNIHASRYMLQRKWMDGKTLQGEVGKTIDVILENPCLFILLLQWETHVQKWKKFAWNFLLLLLPIWTS
jgi:hypothetical protein